MIWLLAACGDPEPRPPRGDDDDDTTHSDTTPPTGDPTWADVAPLLAERCAPCHVGAARPSGGLALDAPDDVIGVVDPQTGLAYVEPFDVATSYLWLKVTDRQDEVPGGGGAQMPALPLSSAELARIEAWILAGALVGDEPTGPTRCDPVAPACESGCAPAPADLDHAAWHPRLTTSPALSWSPIVGAASYEVSASRTPGGDDVACWTDVGDATTHTFAVVWGVIDGDVVYANVRALFADGTVSEVATSAGWTVDVTPPDVPADVVDARAPVDGGVTWTHPGTDVGAGFAGFEVALGTAPYSDDAVPWTAVGADPSAVLGDDVPVDTLAEGAWAWVSVRAVDAAGNASQPGTSPGYITCPDTWAFVPADAALGTTPFCVSRYEMRVEGLADGAVGWDGAYVAESRASGTPWSGVDKSQARIACDALGFSYQLVSNAQWQAVARSVERTDANWSGGAVGLGTMPKGHCDESPLAPLASDGGPCVGTGDDACEDPGSPDWWQRRTHVLHNGEVVWDLSGNLSEQVDGSPGAPAGLWLSFDGAPFTTDPGFEDAREAFAPEGPWADAQGTGRIYGGSGNLTRGGSFDPQYDEDPGVFGGHHNTWWTGGTEGFRCVFVPM